MGRLKTQREGAMALSGSEGIDRATRWGPLSLAGGLGLFVGSLMLGKMQGLPLIGLAVFQYGVYASMMRRWRTEPGLWMLATLAAVGIAPCWVMFEVWAIQAVLWPKPPGFGAPRMGAWGRARLSFDAAVALAVFGRTVWFVAEAGVANWRSTRPEAVVRRAWEVVGPRLLAVDARLTAAGVREVMRAVLDATPEPPKGRVWGRLSGARRERALLRVFPDGGRFRRGDGRE